ncbi:MAG TPA: ATP synthase F0 subunit B [Candidatus Eisenbacteria bacterium]|nr:ATP synthase F0 subunit B [Candidatus Eisenbacteria bacterium]
MEIPEEFFKVLLVQIALFVGLWMVLKRFWFEPALKVIAAREKRSHGAIAEAKAAQDEAARLRREHAAALDQAKSEAQRDVQELLREAEVQQRTLITEATEQAHRTMGEVRSQIEREVASARQQLRADVQAMAREVAKTVLGRAI